MSDQASEKAPAELSEKQREALKAFEAHEAWTVARMIPVDCLEFTSWNVNEMQPYEFAELLAEVEEGGYKHPDGRYIPGFDEPVGVIPIEGEEGRYLVPSGEHRSRAAIALEMTHIPCVLKMHLTELDRSELEMWSVKRNNIKGRINAARYASLEQGWSKQRGIRAEAARSRLLIRGDRLKRLRKNQAVQANEEGGGSAAMGGEGKKGPSSGPIVTADDLNEGDGGGAKHHEGDDAAPYPSKQSGSEPRSNPKEVERQRRKLEADFRAAWEEVLLTSGDTVEHGYLLFAKDGKVSTVIDQPKHLYGLVKRAVAACKGDSASVVEFLATAIAKELPSWEDK